MANFCASNYHCLVFFIVQFDWLGICFFLRGALEERGRSRNSSVSQVGNLFSPAMNRKLWATAMSWNRSPALGLLVRKIGG